MNEPASKEPSMDEILSSIRQIIADDDLAGNSAVAKPGGAKAAVDSAATPEDKAETEAKPEPAAAEPPKADAEPEQPPAAVEPEKAAEEPLALRTEQIVGADESALDKAVAEAEAQLSAHASKETQLVVPDDIGFEGDDADAAEAAQEPDREEPAASAPSGHPSPLPDPSLSGDLADQLMAPTADAATRHAFSQLNALALSGKERTVEDLIREMLRPMLKSWLDENLPGMVERMVQREIERVSRGER